MVAVVAADSNVPEMGESEHVKEFQLMLMMLALRFATSAKKRFIKSS